MKVGERRMGSVLKCTHIKIKYFFIDGYKYTVDSKKASEETATQIRRTGKLAIPSHEVS